MFKKIEIGYLKISRKLLKNYLKVANYERRLEVRDTIKEIDEVLEKLEASNKIINY